MKRVAVSEGESQGQDSFLDVVANMVGILILLVMVVGLRASKLPPADRQAVTTATTTAAIFPTGGSDHQATSFQSDITQLQSELAQLVQQVAANEAELKLREVERVQLLSHQLKMQEELESRTTALDEAERAEHAMVVRMEASRRRLDELAEEQTAILSEQRNVQVIESLPTPLAQTVHGNELHLRLKGGAVSVIPLEALLDQLQQTAGSIAWKLDGQSALEETVGPIDGYRLRYRIVQRRVVVQSAAGPLNQGKVAQLDEWELLPLADDLGQNVEQALLPQSELRSKLANRSPTNTTITVWTYPDSFAEFRRLKKGLFDLGFATAARPLPDGVRIGGSPRGSKSAAQ